MNLREMNKVFKTESDAIKYLEKILWGKNPICPYCNSHSQTILKNENRYHCNSCNTSYSITIGTPFYKSKVDLRKWFVALSFINDKKKISSRELAKEIKVTKDTAWLILNKLKQAFVNYRDLMLKISSKVHELNN